MTGRLIPTASEAEWLAARKHGVTASDIPVIMGLTSWSSPFKLWHQKTGALPDDGDTLRLAAGRHLEPLIVDEFCERQPEFYPSGDGRHLYAHPDRPWQLATPDRLLSDARCTCGAIAAGRFVDCVCPVEPLGVLECKTSATHDEWGEDGSDEIPVAYRAQVLWQMDVLGVGAAYVACLFTHTWQVRVYELTLDDNAAADLKLMREQARDFLDSIGLGQPPLVDWRPATTQTLKALHPDVEDRDVVIGRQLAISYRAAVRRARAAGRRKDEMTNRLLAAIGSGRRAVENCTGLTVATRSVSDTRRIDTGMLRALYPQTAAEVTRTTAVARLTPAKHTHTEGNTP